MFPDVLHYLEKVLVHKILNLDVLDQRRPKDFKLVVFNTLDREQGWSREQCLQDQGCPEKNVELDQKRVVWWCPVCVRERETEREREECPPSDRPSATVEHIESDLWWWHIEKLQRANGDPVNKEVDIRSEMGRLKEEKDKIWSSPTNRTIYQWSESSRTKNGTSTTKTSAFTHKVRNRIRQKYKPSEHSKGERKNGVKSISHGKETTTSPKRDEDYSSTVTVVSSSSHLSYPHLLEDLYP